MPYKRCVMILADGARPDVLEKLLQAGRLPNIKEYLVGPGSFHHGVTSFPSTTGPAYMPFLTGCHPGTCNVPGIRWFDKEIYSTRPWSHQKFRSYVGFESYLMNKDMRSELKTLFQLIPRSFNIFSSINRGVSFENNKTRFFRIWHWYYGHLTDHWSLVDKTAHRKLVKSLDQNPEFIFAVFPGIDEYSHIGDVFSEATFAAYEEIDRTIGDLVSALKRKNFLDETIIVIVSDHGLSATQAHLGINQFLEKRGVKTFYYPVIFKWGFAAANMVSGNGMAHLYFPHSPLGQKPQRRDWRGCHYEETFSTRHKELLDELAGEAALDLLITRRKEGGVHVRRGPLRGELFWEEDKIRYEKISGDPLGYGDGPSLLTPEEWLGATLNTDHPDAPTQLLQIIKSPRTGDVILSATQGFDLRERHEVPEHKGTHGSLHRDHMLIPIISNVPLTGPLRSVDVFPSICRLLGRSWSHAIDGRPRI